MSTVLLAVIIAGAIAVIAIVGVIVVRYNKGGKNGSNTNKMIGTGVKPDVGVKPASMVMPATEVNASEVGVGIGVHVMPEMSTAQI